MEREDCRKVAERLGCSHVHFSAYDKVAGKQNVSFSVPLGKGYGAVAVDVKVVYARMNVEMVTGIVREALVLRLTDGIRAHEAAREQLVRRG